MLLFGCLFKINHWPGAGILLTISIVALTFWFIPAALVNNFIGRDVRDKKWLFVATFITFFIVFLGALFKVQHWPGAGLLLLIGVPIPFILFLPVYLYHNAREKEQSPTNFIGIILGLTFIAVYSVLLAVNVSRNVLHQGVALIKTNESVIDFYETAKNNLMADFSQSDNEITLKVEKLSRLSDEACILIRKAEEQILNHTDNELIAKDMGNAEFNTFNISNIENAGVSQYILYWQDNALAAKIKKNIIELEIYLTTLGLDEDLIKAIDEMLVMEDEIFHSETKPWEKIEFSSDYMIYALESLSRWEKNIRFVESEVLAELFETSMHN